MKIPIAARTVPNGTTKPMTPVQLMTGYTGEKIKVIAQLMPKYMTAIININGNCLFRNGGLLRNRYSISRHDSGSEWSVISPMVAID